MDSNLRKGYETACAQAAEVFARGNPAEFAARGEVAFDAETQTVRLIYLHQPYNIHWPDGAVVNAATSEAAPLATRVLILNYLVSANRQQPTGELIAFRDIPGAATYEGPFTKRSITPFIRTFDGKPDLLYAVAGHLGGRRAAVGDDGVTLDVLPLLPVTYALWHGDEEFPAAGAILFDASARRLLSIECLVVAAANGVYAMMGMARGRQG